MFYSVDCAPQQKAGTILIVDDEGGMRGVAASLLSRHGYSVLEATDAYHALLICSSRRTPIDLIIVDMARPDLNGFELIERIKRMRDDFQVIYVSGYISPRKYLPYAKTLVEGRNLISRPFRLYSLLQMVDNAVRRRA